MTDTSVPTEQKSWDSHLKAWRATHRRDQSRIFLLASIPVSVALMVGSFFVGLPPWDKIFFAYPLVLGALAATLWIIDRRDVMRNESLLLYVTYAMYGSVVLVLSGFAWSCRDLFNIEASEVTRRFSTVNLSWNPVMRARALENAGLIALTFGSTVGILILPLRGLSLAAALAAVLVVTTTVFWNVGHTATWTLIQAIGLGIVGIYSWRSGLLADHLARAEFDKIDLARREVEAKYARELELAKEIQTSAQPPPVVSVGKRISVECFQFTHHKVGGDWMALREMPDGSLVVLVADATGKGIQAALVVHAVQSLWARTLGNERFEPRSFLEEVNTTLKHMGQQKSHTMTMGIVVIEKDLLTYYSAGHPQLYVLEGARTEANRLVHGIRSVGNMLGFGLNLSLRVKTLELPKDRLVEVVLMSDGILDGLTRPYERAMSDLLRAIATVGPHAIEILPCEDDKTMVVVTRQALEPVA